MPAARPYHTGRLPCRRRFGPEARKTKRSDVAELPVYLHIRPRVNFGATVDEELCRLRLVVVHSDVKKGPPSRVALEALPNEVRFGAEPF